MPDKLEDSTVRLERLLRRVTSEKDLDKCDQLGAEIWRVLSERDASATPRANREQIEHREKD